MLNNLVKVSGKLSVIKAITTSANICSLKSRIAQELAITTIRSGNNTTDIGQSIKNMQFLLVTLNDFGLFIVFSF